MFKKFTASARYSLFLAGYESAAGNRSAISPSHILLAIMYLYPAVLVQIVRSRENLALLRQRLVHALSREVGHNGNNKEFQFDDEARRVLLRATQQAKTAKASTSFQSRIPRLVPGKRWCIDPGHILLGILGEQNCTSAELLQEYGGSLEETRGLIEGRQAPKSIESSIVSSLVVVTGEMADPDLERESKAQLSQLLGESTLRYTSSMYLAILGACYEATRLGADAIGAEHLLPGLFAGSAIHLRGTHAMEESLGPIPKVRGAIGPITAISMTPERLNIQARTVLKCAEEESMRLGHQKIGTAHLLLGLLSWSDSPAAEHLQQRGMEIGTMRSRVSAPDFL